MATGATKLIISYSNTLVVNEGSKAVITVKKEILCWSRVRHWHGSSGCWSWIRILYLIDDEEVSEEIAE